MFETYYEISALKEHVDLEELFKAGLDPKLPDDAGDYLLTIACEELNEDWFKLLISKKIDVNCIDSTQESALFKLAKLSHLNNDSLMRMAIKLMSLGANSNYTTPTGNTVFLQACSLGNLDFVKLLIANGANVEASYHDLGEKVDALVVLKYSDGLSTEFVNFIRSLVD